MIKPARFGFNAETAESNAFQQEVNQDANQASLKAIQEFQRMVEKLVDRGIEVTVIKDTTDPIKPDAIFPNNWVTFHANGMVVLYPMLAENRRAEKRREVLDQIEQKFEITARVDLSEHEKNDTFLEGTGSIVFDHTAKIAYASLSPRTDKELFIKTCGMLGYEPLCFHSIDGSGKAIYHTNVMMSIGNGYAVVCLDSISDRSERNRLIASLEHSGKRIIQISMDQMSAYCGNMLELESPNGKNILVMSQTAFDHLEPDQKTALETYCELFPIQIDTIEQIGGGSVRCMIAELFLPKATNV